MTIFLICVIVHLLIGYGILIFSDIVLKEYIETDTIVICLFWSILIPVILIKEGVKEIIRKRRRKKR